MTWVKSLGRLSVGQCGDPRGGRKSSVQPSSSARPGIRLPLERACATLCRLIRRFRSSDKAQVRALHELALRGVGALIEGPAGEALDRDLDDVEASYIEVSGEFLVDDVDGRIVAMGALRPVGSGRAELKRMRVHPEWQRQGRGRSMLDALEQRARDLGFRRLSLDTTAQQVAARSLYTSTGYVQTGCGELYGQAVILMEKAL
jgi:GNAT superfamily N-acetyltransferase